MSGFSPEWLALREPVDHRSRDAALAAELGGYFAGRASIRVVDLGCGTGSNLRGTFDVLPREQHWTLIDYDPRLLEEARRAITAWADEARPALAGDALVVIKGGRRLTIETRQVDLNTDLDRALEPAPDLVTASAFFDLCSPQFIGRFVAAVVARRAAFFTVLTYNGQQSWTPTHPADAAMRSAFVAHQGGDKGFGPSAGAAAAPALGATFQAAGYVVMEADTPWLLGAADRRLIGELQEGFASAVAETGAVDAARIASWRALARTSAVVGHTDTLALPG
ncbi:MAG: SAM-dependent methyltransferase [Hyphomicrobiaceae bacterium]